MQGATQLESSLTGKDRGVLVDTTLTRTQLSALMANKANSVLGCTRRNVTSRSRAGPSPMLSPDEKHLECWVQSWAPQCKRQYTLERVQKRATRMMNRLGHLSHKERMKKMGLVSLEKTHGRGYPFVPIFDEVSEEDSQPLLSGFKDRSNGHKLKCRKPLLNVRKHLFSVNVVKHWSRLPSNAVGSASLKILKNPAGHNPEQPAQSDPALMMGLD
ncbi:hypothetical protein llap_17947 [Limosa lapponica baueri]|uniref:Uncharacterized protein n=1 Tax=Limosa lapponica baueri TaxID=1758121 RepID=A0A2I0TDA5_LIMLA|nr:hypothetical protein llap_17947 [Limosa lapponica baueri]